MNEMTPISDGGGGGSSSSNGAMAGVAAGMKAAALYVEPEELAAFAEVMAEHEQVLGQALEMFADRHTEFQGFNVLTGPQYESYDASTLQLGYFPEAAECMQSFRETTYKGTAISTNHVGAGQQVCGDVMRRTRDNYLTTDDEIDIDNQTLQREIENAGKDGGGVLLNDDTTWEEGGLNE